MTELVTVEQIMAHEPCPYYPESFVRELIGDGKTPMELTHLPIPAMDILWVFCYCEIVSDAFLHSLACDFAEDALPLRDAKYPYDMRSRVAIETKRRWLRGEATEDDLAAAWAAAWDAGAAWAAAWAAGSAGSAAWVAAGAARYAAWISAGARQLNLLRAALEKGDSK